MNAHSDKVERRRRKAPPRRTPSIIEQRERRPIAFGWGADLNHREREALKERIALFGGIALAVLVAVIIGWGLVYDNVIKPAQVRAENNKPILKIGSYTLNVGYFKRLENFRKQDITGQLTQAQQQQSSLQANPKKNAAQLSQVTQQINLLQQQLGTLPTNVETLVLDNQTMIQRARTASITVSTADINKSLTRLQHATGGKLHFQAYLQGTGLSLDEIKGLITGDLLRTKLQKSFAAKVPSTQFKVRASHILLTAKQKALAQQLYDKVRHGASIGPLAKKYSKDTGSAKLGGDLGYFAQGTMVAPFDKAAFSMKVGDVRLVKSQYGYHVIEVTGRKTFKLTSTEKQTSGQQAFQQWMSKEQAALHVQKFMPDSQLPGTAAAAAQNANNPASNPIQIPTIPPVQLPTASTGKTGKSTTKKP